MTCKAFMSDHDRRDHSGGYGWREAAGLLDPHETMLTNAEHTRAALAEAERILAETEPDTPQTASFSLDRVAWRNAWPCEATLAMAESLASALAEWPESDSNDDRLE